MGVKNIQANVDSKLVANQVLGTYVAKEDNMIKYLDIAKGLVNGFKTFSISQVPRSKIKKADALSKIASISFAHLSKQVLVEVLETKSITRKEVTALIEEAGPTWMTELVNYLKEGTLPEDEKEAQKIRLKARYDCQIHRPVTRYPQQPLTLITAPWPLYKWGIDIAGPFSEGPGKVKFLIVAMDYFTKWIEAKAVATITGGQVKKFVWDNIHFASVKHPQSNGLVEKANQSLGEVIPAEIGMPTYRTTVVDVVNNDDELRLNLDLLEERDFVYRSNDASHAVADGKLGPKWEGPYEVTDALGNRAYKLRSTDGTVLPRTWNVTNLKRCYL
uniref:Reverse transcriptase domain-containing protein n=1 Tax=Tanacetum cinerariifolium TaxID=118510 RepID=A0A699IIJ5_TANCI|nr:reverse transcriptase domain-containing protein [Tanacetum cinerariifolium]